MPVLFLDSNSNPSTDKTLDSGDNNLTSERLLFSRPLKGGTLFLTIGGSGTFSVRVKLGDGLGNYGPYKTLKDETQESTYSPATLQFNLQYQDFWGEGVKELIFDIQRESGSGDVPITGAVFTHVF